MRRALVGMMLLACLWARGGDAQPDKKKRPAEVGLLLPIPILQRLELGAEQRNKLIEAATKFIGEHRKELDGVREEISKANEAAKKAREDRDRAAYQKAQDQIASANK